MCISVFKSFLLPQRKSNLRFKMPFQDVARLLQPLLKQARTEAGGAPFQIEATKQLAQIFKLALKELKEH